MKKSSFFSIKWILTTLLAIAAAAVMVRLGIWQLDRLASRRAFNARVLSQTTRPVLDLNQDMPVDALHDMEYRSVVVRGTYDFSQEVLLRNQVYEGQYGYHVLTPLKIEGSQQAVLVDRGWIPYDKAEDLRVYQQPGLVTVKGMIRRPQSKPDFGGVPDPTLQPGEQRLAAWNIVNLDRIRLQVSEPLLPVYVQEGPTGAKNPPYASLPELVLTEGPHFGYALQWFAFATILTVGYPFFVRRQLKSTEKEKAPVSSSRDDGGEEEK